MITLLSPAKSLDFTTNFNCKNHSNHCFKKETLELISKLKKLNIQDLEKLMDISKKLAELNFNRFEDFSKDFNLKNSRQALLAFDGDVYDGIEKNNFDENDFSFAQNHLRILSGLYGVLKPLDLIQAYRLEMGLDFKKLNFDFKNLYQFWGDKISLSLDSLNSSYIINLASNEYFLVINPKKIRAKIINVAFKEEKNGKLKIVGINVKKARGVMANFIIKNKITNPQDLKKFNQLGYKFVDKLSDPLNFIFIK